MTGIYTILNRLHWFLMDTLKRLGIGVGADDTLNRAQALILADAIRARSLPQNADSTDVIRQDRAGDDLEAR